MADKKKPAPAPVPAEEAEPEAKAEQHSAKFYPDIEFNRHERRKTLMLSAALLVMLGGMGVFVFTQQQTVSMIMGAVMLVILVLAVSTIPSAFKQYPVKNEPLIEVTPKEVTVNGKTYKISDIYEVRMTVTVPKTGSTKEEREKFLDALCAAEPERNMTANVDFVLKNPSANKKKDENLYTTVACAYEALLALYKAGCKHYKIVYSMKKLAKLSTYDLGETVTEDGVKLSNVSKKDRLRQLY